MESPRNWISRAFTIMLSVVIVDQVCKVIVLNTMYRGQSINLIGDWFKLTFTENPGMAFGIQFGPPALITIFSLIATVLIVVYLFKVGGMYAPYRISLSMVLGGAFGNIIDRVFYGKILYDEPLFLGKVVDFIHFNVWRGIVPESVPLLGGKYLALFPIWNVADMSIVLGVVGILFFQRRFHELIDGQAAQEDRSALRDEPEAPVGDASSAPLAQDLPGESGSEGDNPGKQEPV
jgi:signal peptidase II